MAYFLQDAGSAYWQLGVTVSGQLSTTSVGTQTIVTLVLQDSAAGYWQLGVTVSGQLSTTSVGVTTITPISLIDSNGKTWNVGVTTVGQLTSTLSAEILFPSDMTPGCNVAWRFR